MHNAALQQVVGRLDNWIEKIEFFIFFNKHPLDQFARDDKEMREAVLMWTVLYAIVQKSYSYRNRKTIYI